LRDQVDNGEDIVSSRRRQVVPTWVPSAWFSNGRTLKPGRR